MMQSITLTNPQARQFLLYKQGLLGDYRFVGKQGVLEYIRQAGCIQFDPNDVCGKNAELVLQSRVKGFTKEMLYNLLYVDRKIFDYFDKNLSVICIEDWSFFSRTREENRKKGRSREQVNQVGDKIRSAIKEKGPICSNDLDFNETVSWYWSDTKLSRAALETLYFRGDLTIHHKKGNIKYYDLAENCIPNEILHATDPNPDDFDHLSCRVFRRIGAVGLLWNKVSDAWLGISELNAERRNNIFKQLLEEEKILELSVTGIKDKLYCQKKDQNILEFVMQNIGLKNRCEFIAPLDNMIWDRKLLLALFNFDYKWEIYTPESLRKYGYYVLPILYGESFIGRIEVVNERKTRTLAVKNIWFEDGIKQNKKILNEIDKTIKRFAGFHHCEHILQ